MPGARITIVARHEDDHAHTVDVQVVPRDAQDNTARTVTLPEDLAAKDLGSQLTGAFSKFDQVIEIK